MSTYLGMWHDYELPITVMYYGQVCATVKCLAYTLLPMTIIYYDPALPMMVMHYDGALPMMVMYYDHALPMMAMYYDYLCA